MWERFEMDGFEPTEPLLDDVDEEEELDAAMRRLRTVNLGAVGPTESSPFYDDGDETITNIMRKIGNASIQHSKLPGILRMTIGPSDDDVKRPFQASTNTSSSTQGDPEWFPYPSKTVR